MSTLEGLGAVVTIFGSLAISIYAGWWVASRIPFRKPRRPIGAQSLPEKAALILVAIVVVFFLEPKPIGLVGLAADQT